MTNISWTILEQRKTKCQQRVLYLSSLLYSIIQCRRPETDKHLILRHLKIRSNGLEPTADQKNPNPKSVSLLEYRLAAGRDVSRLLITPVQASQQSASFIASRTKDRAFQ